jgi:hypothetical protein
MKPKPPLGKVRPLMDWEPETKVSYEIAYWDKGGKWHDSQWVVIPVVATEIEQIVGELRRKGFGPVGVIKATTTRELFSTHGA